MDTEAVEISNAARRLSQKGASKGGAARAQMLTAEERQESARHAAITRWNKFPTDKRIQLLQATHGDPDHPLRIGDVEIPCYVLEDGRRVIVQGGMLKALGMARGSNPATRSDRLTQFAHGKAMRPFISQQLQDVMTTPIFFRTPTGQRAYGYEATVLAETCEAVLEARDAGVLHKHQIHIAAQCDLLMRSFARVGLIALVDEATGYQESRDRDELHKILAASISPTLIPWTQRFPDELYVQLCRLKSWTYNRIHKGPRRLAQLTKQLVYDKLPPGVLDELHRINPPVYKGYGRKHRHHQFLTETIGHPHLDKHLLLLVTILRVAETWQQFETFFAQTFPTPAAPLTFPAPEPDVIDVTPALVEVAP